MPVTLPAEEAEAIFAAYYAEPPDAPEDIFKFLVDKVGYHPGSAKSVVDGTLTPHQFVLGMVRVGWSNDIDIGWVLTRESIPMGRDFLHGRPDYCEEISDEVAELISGVRAAVRAKSKEWALSTERAKEQKSAPPEFIELMDFDAKDLPRRDWLVEDVFERDKLSVTAGQGGSGKSTLALYYAMVIASGTAIGPFKPTQAYRVGLINVEDDFNEQRRRAAAMLMTPDFKKISMTPDLFKNGRLHTLKCDALTLVERNEETTNIRPTEAYKTLVKEIAERKLDFIIIDPLVEITEGINENDNAHMQKVMACLRIIGREQHCHVNVVHHFNKPGEANNPGAVRGGSSIINAARMNLNVEKLNDSDCKTYGIDPKGAHRHNIIKMVIPKANNSPTGAVNFFELVEQKLPNGDASNPPDRVAALKSYKPSQDMAAVTDTIINKFLDDLERGRLDKQGEPSGDRYTTKTDGPEDARATTLLKSAGLSAGQAEAVIRKLTEHDCIAEQEYANHQRKKKTGLVVLKRLPKYPF